MDPRANDVLNENKFGILSRNGDVCLSEVFSESTPTGQYKTADNIG